MTKRISLLALAGLAMAAPAAAQQQSAPQSPFGGLFTSWSQTSRESLRVEAERREPVQSGAIPAYSGPQRSQAEAQALGERVAEVVRRGDCAQGERMARDAGDFPLVSAVRNYCRSNPG